MQGVLGFSWIKAVGDGDCYKRNGKFLQVVENLRALLLSFFANVTDIKKF